MNSLRSLAIGALALLGATLATACAMAAPSHSTCSVNGTSLDASLTYDPFSPSTVNNATVTLRVNRVSSGSEKTNQVDFYLYQPVGSPAYTILNSNGENVLYTNTTHALDAIHTTPGTVNIDFGGNTALTYLDVPLTITFPSNIDLSAGNTVNFDVYYVCNGIGGMLDQPTASPLTAAVKLTVHVLSGAVAYTSGPALDFGDLTNVTAAQASTHQTATGYINVQSSGPYNVDVDSNATDKYRMTYTGGSTSDPTKYVPYTLTVLGRTLSHGSPTFTTMTCTRATLTGVQIPIFATLDTGADAGGVGKLPGSYRDDVKVTISPQLFNAPGQVSCP